MSPLLEVTLQQLLLRFVGAVIILGFHGLVLAWLASFLGDEGPRHDGRATLNPVPHLGTLGTLGLLLLQVGWVKPLLLSPADMRRPRLDPWLLALGALATLVMFILALKLIRQPLLSILPEQTGFFVLRLVNLTVELTLWFLVVNIVPLPPLTGGYALLGLWPLRASRTRQLSLVTGGALLVLAALGWLQPLLQPLVDTLNNWLLG